jgi:hypothetical protein
MRKIAELAILRSEDSVNVSTSMWVKVRIMMARTYLLHKEVGKAIDVLRDICFILPPFPIERLSYAD